MSKLTHTFHINTKNAPRLWRESMAFIQKGGTARFPCPKGREIRLWQAAILIRAKYWLGRGIAKTFASAESNLCVAWAAK